MSVLFAQRRRGAERVSPPEAATRTFDFFPGAAVGFEKRLRRNRNISASLRLCVNQTILSSRNAAELMGGVS